MPAATPESPQPIESRIFGPARDKFAIAERQGNLFYPELDQLGRPLNMPTAAMKTMGTSIAIEVSKLAEAEYLLSLLRLQEGGFEVADYIAEDVHPYLQVSSVPAIVIRAQPRIAHVEFRNPDSVSSVPLSRQGDNIFLGALDYAVLVPPPPTEPTAPAPELDT